jgi:hypothetical protein
MNTKCFETAMRCTAVCIFVRLVCFCMGKQYEYDWCDTVAPSPRRVPCSSQRDALRRRTWYWDIVEPHSCS